MLLLLPDETSQIEIKSLAAGLVLALLNRVILKTHMFVKDENTGTNNEPSS